MKEEIPPAEDEAVLAGGLDQSELFGANHNLPISWPLDRFVTLIVTEGQHHGLVPSLTHKAESPIARVRKRELLITSNISRSSWPSLDTGVFAAYRSHRWVERASTPKVLT